MQPYSGGTAARYTKTVTLPEGDDGFTFWYDSNNEDSDGNVAWAKLLYASDWEELYGVTKGIKCKSFGSKFTDEEVNEFLDGMDFSNISDGRQRIVAATFANSGQFSYSLGSKPVGGPGNVGVKGAYDCSGYVRYLFWLCGYSFDAVNTADYPGAADLQEISISEMQPGDMQVMLSADNGGSMGHVRVFLGVTPVPSEAPVEKVKSNGPSIGTLMTVVVILVMLVVVGVVAVLWWKNQKQEE